MSHPWLGLVAIVSSLTTVAPQYSSTPFAASARSYGVCTGGTAGRVTLDNLNTGGNLDRQVRGHRLWSRHAKHDTSPTPPRPVVPQTQCTRKCQRTPGVLG